ncbi:BrnA antitoxin family protein [Bordetella parapertussis]|uniref:BrnA antitoxin family protein n=1 Tax=Bordetella parapertussis TaxID=519 RepID=UPI0012986A5C|nr:BrnA antitoxin family protein [Bordetella parapertussis]QGC29952.1 BrnA antitoxin family protein [Bordetella parapertussis]QGC50896.1 BrnA antitoxin family protein [Bordetella parapertussis]QGC55063.1 BrnA antitoxin family protein [Bordetella parapertussis]
MKKPDPEKIDRDNPEWTDAEFRRAKPAAEVLPESVHAMLGIRRRGPQKTPTKQVVTIRLSPDVVEAFKASGTGWHTRVDAALRDWLKTHQPG